MRNSTHLNNEWEGKAIYLQLHYMLTDFCFMQNHMGNKNSPNQTGMNLINSILITPCDYRYGRSHFNTSFHYRYGAISQVPRQRSQTWEQNDCFSDGCATITEREMNKPWPKRPHAELVVILSANSFTICMLQAQHEIPRHVYKCSCATHGCKLSLHNIPETSQYPLPP